MHVSSMTITFIHVTCPLTYMYIWCIYVYIISLYFDLVSDCVWPEAAAFPRHYDLLLRIPGIVCDVMSSLRRVSEKYYFYLGNVRRYCTYHMSTKVSALFKTGKDTQMHLFKRGNCIFVKTILTYAHFDYWTLGSIPSKTKNCTYQSKVQF